MSLFQDKKTSDGGNNIWRNKMKKKKKKRNRSEQRNGRTDLLAVNSTDTLKLVRNDKLSVFFSYFE